MTGERGLRVEARDAGRLADQLGRRERTAAGQRQQIRTEALDQAGDLALEGVDRHGQLADPYDELASQPADDAWLIDQTLLQRGQDMAAVE